jgi:hypothetical protein
MVKQNNTRQFFLKTLTVMAIRLGDKELGVRFLAGARGFSLLQNAQTGPDAYSASYSLRTEVLSPTVKGLGHNTQLSSPGRSEVKNECTYTCTPRAYIHDIESDNFTYFIIRWAVKSCRLVNSYRRFEGSMYHHGVDRESFTSPSILLPLNSRRKEIWDENIKSII